MERSGNQSVYGDFTISVTPHSGSEQAIARANGGEVYTPNPKYRRVWRGFRVTLGIKNRWQRYALLC